MKPLSDQRGVTMIELLLVMFLTIIVLTAATNVLMALVTQFKQQTKIAETNIEAVVGLEIMRSDVKTAGFGLPWVMDAAVNYSEATGTDADDYNDGGSTAPRAFVMGDNVGANASDYLVVKSVIVGSGPDNTAAGKWHTYTKDDDSVEHVNYWQPASAGENLAGSDRVVVHKLASTVELIDDGGGEYRTLFSVVNTSGSAFAPADDNDVRVIYGIVNGVTPRMPFNRADYYISTADVPQRCAPNTGVLVKSVVSHATGALEPPLALLDCVADMQVFFALDGNRDGDFVLGEGTAPDIDSYSEAPGASAEDVRNEVKQVKIYILAHEGQVDPNYTYSTSDPPDPTVEVGEAGHGGHTGVNEFNLETAIGGRWQNYRWKIFRIIESPGSLGG